MQLLVDGYKSFLLKLKYIDWLGPLALRLYLAPIFIGLPIGSKWWLGLATPTGDWVCQLLP